MSTTTAPNSPTAAEKGYVKPDVLVTTEWVAQHLNDPKVKALAEVVPPRPPGFCIGCPERPIFAAMKMVQNELGHLIHRAEWDVRPFQSRDDFGA